MDCNAGQLQDRRSRLASAQALIHQGVVAAAWIADPETPRNCWILQADDDDAVVAFSQGPGQDGVKRGRVPAEKGWVTAPPATSDAEYY